MFRLPAYLVALALILLVPTLGLATAVVLEAVRGYRSVFEARLQDTAHALALALDATIEKHIATIQTLAASGSSTDPPLTCRPSKVSRAGSRPSSTPP